MGRWAILCAAGLFFPLSIGVAQQTIPDDPYAVHLREGIAQAAQGNFSAAIAQVQSALAIRPEDAAGWYQLGSLLGQTGDFSGAGAAFRHAILLQPGMARAHYGLALTRVGNPQETEDWPGAVAECREALKLQPAYPEALNLMGVGLTRQGEYSAAISALGQAIQLSPSSPQAHFNLGLALENSDRLDDAGNEYRAAIAAKGQYPEASSALAKLLFRAGKPAAAEQEVIKALQANLDLTDAHYTRARILQALHRSPEAAFEFAIAKELTERPANAIQSSQMSNQALAMASKGDLAGATAILRKAIALKPDYGVPHFNLGLVLADQVKTEAAVQELSKAISLLPGQASPWFELGRVLEVANDKAGALQAVTWAAHLAPANGAIQAELRRLQVSSSAVPDSAGSQALEPPPIGARSDTAAAHFDYAQKLDGRHDFEGAVGELMRSLALQPANQAARRDLAAAYANLGENDRAVLEYRKVLVASADDVAAHIALGKLLLEQGNPEDAAAELNQALHYQPGSVEAKAFLRRADDLMRPH